MASIGMEVVGTMKIKQAGNLEDGDIILHSGEVRGVVGDAIATFEIGTSFSDYRIRHLGYPTNRSIVVTTISKTYICVFDSIKEANDLCD